MKQRARRVFWNAALMSAGALLMRTVSVWFGVFLSKSVGAEAMGLFSLMSGVYGFALTLATSGIHLGVTHLVVQQSEKSGAVGVRAVMRAAILYALCFGLSAAVLLCSLAKPIGVLWLKDVRTVPSLRLFSITLPLISLTSVFGGYFTAVRRTYKTVPVQVGEQAVKIGATMLLLVLVAGGGVERTLAAVVLGGALAELLSFLASLILYLTDRCAAFSERRQSAPQGIGKRLCGIALPVAFTAYLRSGLVTLQHILIPEGLRKSGAGHAEALAAYGTVQGMALPIVLYPAALISSFSGLLIPELAEGIEAGHKKNIQYIITRVWSLVLFFSIGVGGVMACFSAELGAVLYPNADAGRYIRIFAPLVPIMYIDTATDAMMKGLGEQVASMKINIADAALSVLLVWLLVPHFGLWGYLLTVYISELFNTVLSIVHLMNISHARARVCKWVWKPLISVVAATAVARWFFNAFFSLPPTALSLTLHCTVTLALYLFLLCITRAIDTDDLKWLGRKE